jgi:hypothetical protein
MPIAPHRHDRAARLGAIAFGGALAFALVCLAVQFARSDLDWTTAPLSFYLVGAYGPLVKAVYVALGAALVALGFGFRAARVPERARIAPALFALGGIALVVTAFAESATRSGTASLEARIHGLAAMTAFLSVTLAMLWQSLRLRGDADWRARFPTALPLAVLAFLALLAHALLRVGPRGVSQKAVIVLILAWLAIGAWRLRTAPVRPAPVNAA